MSDVRTPIGIGARILVLSSLAIFLAGCNEDSPSSPTAANPAPSTAATSTPVAASNQAPTIAGAPAQAIAVNQTYSFAPSATDANGDTLTFQIQNKPTWASFSASNGRLQGTPAAGDVGTYSGIVISVTDGVNTQALNAFAINVTQISTGSATVSWTPPTQNEDGSPLTNLAGYRIYYGKSQSDLSQFVTINNIGLATFQVDNLSPATWHFAVKAFTTNGVESDFSNLASKTIT